MLQNLLAPSTPRQTPGWAGPGSSRVATEPGRGNTASQVVAPDISEEGARMPATGTGRRHLSLASPATAAAPDRGEVSLGGGAATTPMPGPGSAQDALRHPPSPVPSVGAAALPEERPSRALCPAAAASRAPPPQAVPKRRVRDARSRAAEPPRPPHGRRSGPPRETGPPSAYSPSLGAAGSALLSVFPRRRRRSLRLPGRPRWALGLGWVKGRRWARAGLRSRGGPASRQALTGPGAQGQADRGGERGGEPR